MLQYINGQIESAQSQRVSGVSAARLILALLLFSFSGISARKWPFVTLSEMQAERYANRAIPRAARAHGEWPTNGPWQIERVLPPPNAPETIHTDTYARIRAKETAGLSMKRYLMSHKEE